MAKISLICEQCGGNIVLDDSHEIGTCEHCYAQFIVKQDEIVQKITQNITKHVYGYEGKDVEELLTDGYTLMDLGDKKKANAKFKRAIDIEPECWSAWLGYASTGGDGSNYLSIVPAYEKAFCLAEGERREVDTFIDMIKYLPDQHLRAAFIRAFNIARHEERFKIFELVLGVIGRDESEMANLAVDICPNDWRAHFAMAKFRKIRVRWCELEGGLFKKHLPSHALDVLNIFMRAYNLAKNESEEAKNTILSYIENMGKDDSYRVFYKELASQIKGKG